MEATGEVSKSTEQMRTMQGPAPGLEGLHGRVRVDVAGMTVGFLVVDDGQVAFTQDDGEVRAAFVCHDREVLDKLRSRELNPFVAALQGRFALSGDVRFGIQVLLGLQASSPFATRRTGADA